METPRVGISAVDVGRRWLGGRYYLIHLVRAVRALPDTERVPIRDVWWLEVPKDDPFAEIRSDLGPSVVIAPALDLVGRVMRRSRAMFSGRNGASDLFKRAGIDVVFPFSICDNPGIPVVFWVPDFNYRRVSEYSGAGSREATEAQFRRNSEAAVIVVLSSEDSRSEFVEVFPDLRHKTRVLRFTSIPGEEWGNLDPQAVAVELGLPEKYLLLSNQLSHHKNHMLVLEALRILRIQQRPVKVVCTGSPFGFRKDEFTKAVEHFIEAEGLREQLTMLGELSRDKYIAVMRRSIGVIQPSLYEGWSTPVEDAKTLGKPVLANRIPVFVEQLGERHAYFASATTSEAWAESLSQIYRSLPPGPDASIERPAIDAARIRASETGRTFVKIMVEALSHVNA